MRKWKNSFATPSNSDPYYDLIDDWDLIEASFAAQYGIRMRSEAEENMRWSEFLVLLQGLMPETPLGNIVSIRSETDKDILKNFTPEQKRIRQEWHSRRNQQAQHMDRASFDQAMKSFETMFAGISKKER